MAGLEGLLVSIAGGGQTCCNPLAAIRNQHRNRRKPFKPGPRARLEAQTTRAVGHGFGCATQNAQTLLVEVVQASAQSTAGGSLLMPRLTNPV